MHDLQVTVNTSNKGQADFDGDVYLTLGGGYSTMDEVQLTGDDLESAGGLFVAGSALSFSIRAPEMGALTNATIRVVRVQSSAIPLVTPQPACCSMPASLPSQYCVHVRINPVFLFHSPSGLLPFQEGLVAGQHCGD